MSQSAGGLWTPRLLRQSPVNAFQQISQLRRRDRHRALLTLARSSGRPDKTTALQPLRKQTHALAVVPQHLDQRAAPAAKDEQMTVVWIALERLLHQQCQAVEALAHVGMAGGQPYLHPARNRDHRRRPLLASTATVAPSVAGSTAPLIRIRVPFVNSTSISPAVDNAAAAGSAAICTAANVAAGCDRRSNCRRHPYSCPGWTPASRAIAETVAPRSSEAATSPSFSAVLQRRRRSTEVMTSIAGLLM